MCSELFSSAHFLTITTVIKTSFPTPAGKLYCWVAMTLPPLLMILWTANLHDTISKVAKIFSNWLLYHAIEDCYLCCPTSRGCEQTKKDLGRGKLRLSLNTNEWWLSRLLTNKQCSLPLRIFFTKKQNHTTSSNIHAYFLPGGLGILFQRKPVQTIFWPNI